MSIGERIAELRIKCGLSQIELARQLGVSRQAVSKWENDLSNPDTRNLIHLADILCTDVEYLATGSTQQRPSPLNDVSKDERIMERLVENKTVKIQSPLNPLILAAVAIACFVLGLMIGLSA